MLKATRMRPWIIRRWPVRTTEVRTTLTFERTCRFPWAEVSAPPLGQPVVYETMTRTPAWEV